MIREKIISISKPHLLMQITQGKNVAKRRKDLSNVTQEAWVSLAQLHTICVTLSKSLSIRGFFIQNSQSGMGTPSLALRIQSDERQETLENAIQVHAAVTKKLSLWS